MQVFRLLIISLGFFLLHFSLFCYLVAITQFWQNEFLFSAKQLTEGSFLLCKFFSFDFCSRTVIPLVFGRPFSLETKDNFTDEEWFYHNSVQHEMYLIFWEQNQQFLYFKNQTRRFWFPSLLQNRFEFESETRSFFQHHKNKNFFLLFFSELRRNFSIANTTFQTNQENIFFCSQVKLISLLGYPTQKYQKEQKQEQEGGIPDEEQCELLHPSIWTHRCFIGKDQLPFAFFSNSSNESDYNVLYQDSYQLSLLPCLQKKRDKEMLGLSPRQENKNTFFYLNKKKKQKRRKQNLNPIVFKNPPSLSRSMLKRENELSKWLYEQS